MNIKRLVVFTGITSLARSLVLVLLPRETTRRNKVALTMYL